MRCSLILLFITLLPGIILGQGGIATKPAVIGISHRTPYHEDLTSQIKKATAYHEQADYAHSIPILKRVVQQSPMDYSANLLLGEDLFHSGDIQDAVAPLELACRVRPQDATAEVYLADAAANLGDFPKASEALQAGIARSGGSERFLEAWASYCLERYRILGLSLRATKQGEAVALRVEAASHPEGSETRESLLKESAAIDPEQPGIWGELGIAQLELGKRAEMLESLREAQNHESQGTGTLQFEALLAAAERNWPEAEERLTALGERSPSEFRSALALWQHVLVPTSTSGAIATCLRKPAIPCPLAPMHAEGEKSLSAKDLYAEGRWERLIALPSPPAADSVAWLWRGVALARTGDCPRAIPPLELGIKADELVAGFWLEVCYSSETERTAARLSTEKDQASLHQLQGDLMLRLRGNAAAACVQYREALKSRPHDPLLLERLAEAQLTAGETEDARQSALAALAIDPHRHEALRTLASLAMDNRDYAQALPWLRQLVAEAPGDTTVQVQLGKALAQTGNAAEALHWLAPALKAGYPDERGALHALEARALREQGRDAEAVKAEAEARRLSDAFQTRSSNSAQEGPDAKQ
jgi:tetratricopeptide (TPR) repeat protein